MPQMSPMWWTSLMYVFLLMMMLTNSMMYFNYSKNMQMKMTHSKKNLKWMW